MNTHPHPELVVAPTRIVPPAPVAAQQPVEAQAASSAECGSGWYHDVAIQESRQAPARKH